MGIMYHFISAVLLLIGASAGLIALYLIESEIINYQKQESGEDDE